MKKCLALIAQDNQKTKMAEWAKEHKNKLEQSDLCATQSTGSLVEAQTKLKLHKYKSGPLGGDQQIGGAIAEGKIHAVVFFWDPLAPHPHDVDVKALLRIAAVYDIPMACNLSSANLLIKGFDVSL